MNGESNETRAILEWYRAMGVDETVGYAPRSWINATDGPLPALAVLRHPRVVAPFPPHDVANAPSDEADALPASKAVCSVQSSPDTIDAVRADLEAFDGCGLKATAKRLCLYRGPLSARVIIIGEAPDKQDDATGIPFSGPEGRFLDRMLACVDLGNDTVYMTNLVFWKPPGNRKPTVENIAACRLFVDRQIDIVRPDIIICLGSVVANALTGNSDPIAKIRNSWLSLQMADNTGNRTAKVIAIYPPAYLLRNPLAKRLAWRDMLTISDALACSQNSIKK